MTAFQWSFLGYDCLSGITAYTLHRPDSVPAGFFPLKVGTILKDDDHWYNIFTKCWGHGLKIHTGTKVEQRGNCYARKLDVNAVDWEAMGYVVATATPLPANALPVPVGDTFQKGDLFDSAGTWAPIDPMTITGMLITSTTPCVVRPGGTVGALRRVSISVSAPMRPSTTKTWHCNSSACFNRENDAGFPCYWCGTREKI